MTKTSASSASGINPLPQEKELRVGIDFYCTNCGEPDPDPTSLIVPVGWGRYLREPTEKESHFRGSAPYHYFLCPKCEGVE